MCEALAGLPLRQVMSCTAYTKYELTDITKGKNMWHVIACLDRIYAQNQSALWVAEFKKHPQLKLKLFDKHVYAKEA